MIGSLNTVSSKISGVISSSRIRRSSEILSCESFVSLVDQFVSIADDDSEADSMKKLATNVTEATVETCTLKERDTLKNATDYLDDISILLQKDLDYYLLPTFSDFPTVLELLFTKLCAL